MRSEWRHGDRPRLLRRLLHSVRRSGARARGAAAGRRLHDGDLPMIVVAHIGGLPVEESIAQLAPAGIVALAAAHAARERTRRYGARLRGARTRLAQRRSA